MTTANSFNATELERFW